MPNGPRSVGLPQRLSSICIKAYMRTWFRPSFAATASYRLMPSIVIKKPIPSHLCEKFAHCFAPGVIEIDSTSGAKTVRVANPRKDTLSREVYRHPEFREAVELGRVRDHYICKRQDSYCQLRASTEKFWLLVSIESCGQYPAQDLVPAGAEVLLSKIRVLQQACRAL